MVRRSERLRALSGDPSIKKVKTDSSHTITPVETDPNILWENFKQGLNRIFVPSKNRVPLSHRDFIKLYTDVTQICIRSDVGPSTGLGIEVDFSNKRGEYLYERLASYLKDHLSRILEEGKSVEPEQIPQFYVEQYNDFRVSAQVLDAVCKYLNQRFVDPERPSTIKLLTVYELAMYCWKNTLFKTMHESTLQWVLAAVRKERNDEMLGANAHLVKDAISSFVELGVIDGKDPSEENETEPKPNRLKIYQTFFESRYLEETRDFCERMSGNPMASYGSFTIYEEKVEQWFNSESERIRKYFHSSTIPKLNAICGKILLEGRFNLMTENFSFILSRIEEEPRIPALARTFNLVSRLNESFLEMLCFEFKEFVESFGYQKLKDIPPNEFLLYVETVLNIYGIFRNMIRDAFRSNLLFNKAMDTAFEEFLNKERRISKKATRCAEYMARYLGYILRKSTKTVRTPEEIEEKVEAVMSVFRYVRDKDVFQNYYARGLAQRLLSRSSTSNDSETFVMTKLDIICGQDFTVKYKRMFRDLTVSADLQDQFKEFLESRHEQLSHDFSVTVLTNGCWPGFKKREFALPEMLEESKRVFNNFYTTRHNGRVLNWNNENSIAELKYCPPENQNQQFTFTVSTYQMCILLMYNTKDVYSVAEIQEATKLDLIVLFQILTIFKSCKLLRQEPPEEPMSPDSKFRLFGAYRSNKIRLNINQPLKTETKIEDDKTNAEIEKTRAFSIQAAIVRIMKTRKSLKHQALIGEVIAAMNQHFQPEIRMIRNCIEILMTKEYLVRDENDRDSYIYVA